MIRRNRTQPEAPIQAMTTLKSCLQHCCRPEASIQAMTTLKSCLQHCCQLFSCRGRSQRRTTEHNNRRQLFWLEDYDYNTPLFLQVLSLRSKSKRLQTSEDWHQSKGKRIPQISIVVELKMLLIMKLVFFCSSTTLLLANHQDFAVDAGLVRTNVHTNRATMFNSNAMIGTVSASKLVQKQRKTILHMSSESSDINIVTAVAKTTPATSSSLKTTITTMIKQTLPAGNTADDLNQLTPSMAALIVVSGLAVGQFVASTRKLLPVVNTWFNRAPAFGPLVGSMVVAALYWYCKDLGKGMETIYAPLSKEDISASKGKNVDVNSTFSLRRQALRLMATIATLSSGCAMAFTGPAAELGMTIGRSIGLKMLKSESARRRLVLACAGAGMTANFDTPLTAVFFASEISQAFIKDPTVNMDAKTTAASKRMDTIALLLACAASSFVCRGFGYLGAGHPALNSFSFTFSHNPFELGVFALLGAFGALLNVYFERGRKVLVTSLVTLIHCYFY